jgi:hypothetical protein
LKFSWQTFAVAVAAAASLIACGTSGQPNNVVTKADCSNSSLIGEVDGRPTGANLSAELEYGTNGTAVWSMQYVCDGREIRDDAAWVKVQYDSDTRRMTITWGVYPDARLKGVQWLAISVKTHNGYNPYVKLPDPSVTSISSELPPGGELYHVSVAAKAPNLPPPPKKLGDDDPFGVFIAPSEAPTHI